MIFGTKEEYVRLINGRIPVLITDSENDDTFIHSLTLAPKGVNVTEAKNVITEAFKQAKKENPEEWTYDDVTTILFKQGFDCFPVSVWEEQLDGYSH